MTENTKNSDLQVWIIDHSIDDGTMERLGDGRAVANKLGCRVGVLLVGAIVSPERLISHGADLVLIVEAKGSGQATRLEVAWEKLRQYQLRLVLASGESHGREWASRLAVKAGWRLVSPALLVECRHGTLTISALDETNRYARQVELDQNQTAVVTLRPGVAEALPGDHDRKGEIKRIHGETLRESIVSRALIPADPKTVDIRFARRLVSGGRGLGSKEGFDTLRRFADRIGAGIAASRMAVDLGWIEFERQVGQTGKTVKPELYVACGISGASHHLEGISEAKHVVAINTDKDAPIFQVAHLGLVADLHQVLNHAIGEISD